MSTFSYSYNIILLIITYTHTHIYTRVVRAGGLSPPPFHFLQGFWGCGGKGDTDGPSAKECAVLVGGVVLFEVQ